MLKLSYLSIALLLLFSTACSQTNDFDTLCGYFDSMENEANLEKMSDIDKFTYINKLVNNNLNSNSDARASWSAIVNLTADKRYQMFIEAAEASLNKPWQCASMKKHIINLPD